MSVEDRRDEPKSEVLKAQYRERFDQVLKIEKETRASFEEEVKRQLGKAREIVKPCSSSEVVDSYVQQSKWMMETVVAAKQADSILGRLKEAAKIDNRTKTEIPFDESLALTPKIILFNQYYPRISGEEIDVIVEGREWAKRTLLGLLERKDTPLLIRLRRDLAQDLARKQKTASYRSFANRSGDHEEKVCFRTKIPGINVKYFYKTDSNFPNLFLVVNPL